ncbi:MAG: hypothetical protein ACNA8L_07165 [Luteolibacter sp.]|jgi:hypothetical protein
MRHWVNFGLLFSFVTLSVTGVMAYALPFSIHTARVHIVFGGLTVLLVLLHMLSRTRYFSGKLAGKSAARGMVSATAAAVALVLAIAFYDQWPARPIMDASYEARRKVQIVRSSPLAGFLDVDPAHRFVARKPDEGADISLSLMVRFRDDLESTPAIAIWAETTAGTIIETLYLDEALAYSEEVTWQGVRTVRHKLLPMWRHKHTVVSGVDPHGKLDAFAGATPEHSFTLDQNLKIEGADGFILCVEVNAVRDSNEAFPDPDLGQPSVLYTAFIQPGKGNPYGLLELTAHGGEAQEVGAANYDFEGLDSALGLVDLLLVKTAPMEP